MRLLKNHLLKEIYFAIKIKGSIFEKKVKKPPYDVQGNMA